MMINKQLELVACFWKNNLPGGIGFVLKPDGADGADFDDTIMKVIKLYEDDFQRESNKEAMLDSYQAQLDEWANVLPTMSPEERIGFGGMIMGNLYILQKYGRIDPADNFNGVVFSWAFERSTNRQAA
jgi:hypothetical protein